MATREYVFSLQYTDLNDPDWVESDIRLFKSKDEALNYINNWLMRPPKEIYSSDLDRLDYLLGRMKTAPEGSGFRWKAQTENMVYLMSLTVPYKVSRPTGGFFGKFFG